MEVVSFFKEMLHQAAEYAASYSLGQMALRYVDKVLWTIEKSARWAVPPPLDQDERQPELTRPLPWVFFLMLLVVLRVTRETISLINLALGKPPLRSADMVTYIQSKRRYLRTLKYQGSRMMRARSEPAQSWRSGLYSLFEFTMCFRRPHYANDSSHLSNTDEVVIVTSNKRSRTASDASMERLMEKMMVELEAESDESSSCTLTNAKSDKSDSTESDIEMNTLNKSFTNDTKTASTEHIVTSTPEKSDLPLPKEDISVIRDSHVESILNFIQHERNGQAGNCTMALQIRVTDEQNWQETQYKRTFRTRIAGKREDSRRRTDILKSHRLEKG